MSRATLPRSKHRHGSRAAKDYLDVLRLAVVFRLAVDRFGVVDRFAVERFADVLPFADVVRFDVDRFVVFFGAAFLLVVFFFAAVFFALPCDDDFFALGTFPPSFRASERPMAMA